MDFTFSLIVFVMLFHCVSVSADSFEEHQLNEVALSHTSFVTHNKKGARILGYGILRQWSHFLSAPKKKAWRTFT